MTEEDSDDSESLDVGTLATISKPYKVLGQLSAGNGIGVVGNNTATSGEGGIGVKGIIEANPGGETTDPPTAVVGEATGTSGRNRGVVGINEGKDGVGVYGRAQNPSGSADGVIGVAEGSGDAVLARGNARVTGRIRVFDTFVSVYKAPANSQSIGNTLEKIVFEKEERDDFNGYDEFATSPTDYTVQNDGAYRVEAQIQWGTIPNSDTKLELVLEKDFGSGTRTLARNVEYVASDSWSDFTMGVSKAVSLFDGDKVYVKASKAGTGTKSVAGGRPNTYLTLTRIG